MRNSEIFMLLWRCAPTWVRASSFMRFLDHTQRYTTVGRPPPTQRILPDNTQHSQHTTLTTLTAHNTHSTQHLQHLQHTALTTLTAHNTHSTQHSQHTTLTAHNTHKTQNSAHNTHSTQHSRHTTLTAHNTHSTQHSQHITLTTHKHLCLWRNSNSQSQKVSGCRPTPYTARQLGSADTATYAFSNRNTALIYCILQCL